MYKLSIYPKEGTPYNPVHDEFQGAEAKIITLQPGYSGLFEAVSNEDGEWSTIHTSTIQTVEHSIDGIRVATRNTNYFFEAI